MNAVNLSVRQIGDSVRMRNVASSPKNNHWPIFPDF